MIDSSFLGPSGQWLTDVPARWNNAPLWSMFDRIKDVEHPDEMMLSVFRDYGVVPKESRENLNKTAENRNIYQLVHPGWFVVNRMKAWQGSVGISEYRGIVSGHYICFAPTHQEDVRYLNYALRSDAYRAIYQGLSRGVRPGQIEIDNGQLRKLPISLPPLEEQQAITEYLDREIGQIDALIAAQERFIGLLQERRQAVIGHAFQELPNSRIQLRRFIQFLTSGSRGWGDYYADDGDVFVRIGNLPRQSLELGGEIQRVDLPPHVREGQRTRLREKDLLFSITAYIGSVAVVGPGWVDAYVSQHVALCRLDLSRLDPRFVGYFMLGTEGQDQLLQGAVGGTKVQLALDDIRGLRIPAPTLQEQRRIAAHLDSETAKIDKLIVKTKRHIDLAKERKSALITAAVTGQIDITKGA
ncbi:restriction endonuclease subunit S [Streptomyces torulosus]|uniref:restriction endonuclease subunit S n=1 Tax=Streptomyces torulosus TaxID=68276 RepID=UPI000A605070|nr:restriction endonuclease subunit S [Streptomyces torulosus]